jgi:hypothetical protein
MGLPRVCASGLPSKRVGMIASGESPASYCYAAAATYGFRRIGSLSRQPQMPIFHSVISVSLST